MKANSYYFIIFWMVGILFNACDSQDEIKNKLSPEAEIIQQLPLMYLTAIPVEETRVINDAATFNALFSAADIEQYEELAAIDWDTQTLLIGRSCHTNPVNIQGSEFERIDENSYRYRIDLNDLDTLAVHDFMYGAVVKKLTEYSKVKFESYIRPFHIVDLWKKDLPKMPYLESIPVGETRVINDAVTFNSIFNASDIEQYKDLRSIDWDTKTLLIGRSSHPNGVDIWKHLFKKNGDGSYHYEVKIRNFLTTVVDDFIYGIIVEKLPVDAKVVFEYSICDFEEEVWPEAKIIKELPQMYVNAISIGSTWIVNNATTFNEMFGTTDIEKYKDLTSIDWNTQTLLVGRSFHTNLVNIFGHTFTRLNERSYHYKIEVDNTDATAIDDFMYGIIVKKLPFGANVVFEYSVRDPESGHELWKKELPKMYLNAIPEGETRVINDATTFNSLFSASDIEQYKELAEIDWDRQTLLIGRKLNSTLVNILGHVFEKTGEQSYYYRIEIHKTGAESLDDFIYGIVVEKLPSGADVTFDYKIVSE